MKSIDPEHENTKAFLAIVHHANQYVITDGYADREGVKDVIGLGCSNSNSKGMLPLLQMHQHYQIPFNLHLSATLIETLAWHFPQSFALVKQLYRKGLIEIVGSTFSQNVMPFFSDDINRRQLGEAFWLYREHLGIDLKTVKTFWVPERVWNTAKLAHVISDNSLPNGGYRNVLLDDRLVFPLGTQYQGGERQCFDQAESLDIDAFRTWDVKDGCGLVMLPISKELRYLIPPSDENSFNRLYEIFNWLAVSGCNKAIAIYGDDLEKAAGVGGWDSLHPDRYEYFLKWLCRNRWIRPVRINDWTANHATAGARRIDPGTFYELAQIWNAGEDYRRWYEDPNCFEHRQYLRNAEHSLVRAEKRGAEAGLLRLGWKHLFHCSYETSWHDPHNYDPSESSYENSSEPRRLAGWSAALTSHARSCNIIALAADWFSSRDGNAHVESVDLDGDGKQEILLKNDYLFAVFSPKWGGRLVYLFDMTGRSGRMVVGNISDDWNLQEELNRYMDCPRNHPGGFSDLEHEHDRYHAEIHVSGGESAYVSLRNVEPESPLYGTEKHIRLKAQSKYLSVSYRVSEGIWRLSTEICLSPNYYSLLRHGKKRLATYNKRDLRGWGSGSAHVWARINSQQSTFWDSPYQNESGHGFNLRITSLSREFSIDLGVGSPLGYAGRNGRFNDLKITSNNDLKITSNNDLKITSNRIALPEVPLPAEAAQTIIRAAEIINSGDERLLCAEDAAYQLITNPHFVKRLLNKAPSTPVQWLKVHECGIRILKPHHDRATLEYALKLRPERGSGHFTKDVIGIWRQDGRSRNIYELLNALSQKGFHRTNGLSVPEPIGYWGEIGLLITEKADGRLLKQLICNPDLEWPALLRRIGAWLARLHRSEVKAAQRLDSAFEVEASRWWMEDLMASNQNWLSPEMPRIETVLQEIIYRQQSLPAENSLLIHGDFHPENILVQGNRITVVDFEHCVMGEPAEDIGYFLSEIDIQSDRYWKRRGFNNPYDIESFAGILLEEYSRVWITPDVSKVLLHRARTYVKHLVYTIRMRGAESLDNVKLWLDKAMMCLDRDAHRQAFCKKKERELAVSN